MIARLRLTILATGCLVLLSACQEKTEETANDTSTVTGRTIHLGDIVFTAAAPGTPPNHRLAQGSFTFGPPQAGEPSIQTDGHGGACLLQQQNQHCTGAQDPNKGAAECSPPTNGWGYCLDQRTLPQGNVQGQCWIKGPKDCLRAPRENNGQLLAEGITYQVPKAEPVLVRRPAKVRMAACVNGPQSTWAANPDGTKTPPCALPVSNNRIDILGPAIDIPPP